MTHGVVIGQPAKYIFHEVSGVFPGRTSPAHLPAMNMNAHGLRDDYPSAGNSVVRDRYPL